jgi:hypothetical protein
MFWKSEGLIFNPSKKINVIKSHGWVPTPFKINDNIFKVFYAGRDKYNHSNIFSFDYSFKEKKIKKYSKKPILKKGRLGCFDDCAVIPSHIIKINNKIYLYYIGWTRGVSVPYISSLGLALSNKINGNFKKYSEAPILGRNKNDPIFTASCFVYKNKKNYEMIYTSNKSWKNNSFFIPNYNLKIASSKNGVYWNTNSNFLLKNKSTKEIAITRPWLIYEKKKKFLFYSYKDYKNKGRNYKIGYAEKYENKWIRKDKNMKFQISNKGFDKNMQEYGSIVKHDNNLYMFYNGNNYGEDGIGLARLEKE